MSRRLPDDAEKYLSSLAASDDRETIYLSTPITTGPQLIAFLSGSGASLRADASGVEDVRKEVVRENLSRLKPVRNRVRKSNPNAHIIDPTSLEVSDWSQSDYHRFWIEVIRRYADRIVFTDGWELSTGCVLEFAAGLELGLPMTDTTGALLTPSTAAAMLRKASEALASASLETWAVDGVARLADGLSALQIKDAQLAMLAKEQNVARFVSFTPDVPYIRYCVLGEARTPRAKGTTWAIEKLLESSTNRQVNVRTFTSEVAKGNPFHYGLRSVDEVLKYVREAARSGYYCIVNETIDVEDGGVSGVTLGGIAEFAPDSTPRVVEGTGAARLPLAVASHVLKAAYGDDVRLPAGAGRRYEFSVHPQRVGSRNGKSVVWESENVAEVSLPSDIEWPNRFSELLGDKTFGLLIADAIGVPVPRTTVVNRRIAPFSFGRSTGSGEWWMRTAPARQTPGHFTTIRGWADPFKLLEQEDPDREIASVLSQEGVSALFSGATLPALDDPGHIVEGVPGWGDSFMLGLREASEMPSFVRGQVLDVLERIEAALGHRARIEWAADEQRVWVLQLHRVSSGASAGVFSPGEADRWLPFDPEDGLSALADVVAKALQVGAGVEVIRPVGLTSHVGDVLRKSGVPGRLKVS